MKMLLLFSLLAIFSSLSQAEPKWPVPYHRVKARPPTDPYCKALYPFCPTGAINGSTPIFQDDDVVDVFLMKAPVWEFKFGDLLSHFNIMHDAVGVSSRTTGKNYTLEWYELFQLANCTFPHVSSDMNEPLWCNQGAACLYEGIDDPHWLENGTLKNVATISGQGFNKFSDWIHRDNDTGVFYETWNVYSTPASKQRLTWFESFDCASFVIRAFRRLHETGATFIENMRPKYTRANLFSKEPVRLGPADHIFHNKSMKRLADDIRSFYSNFQAHQSFTQLIESLIRASVDIFVDGKFYFYFNSEYWLLPIIPPYVTLTYDEIPFF